MYSNGYVPPRPQATRKRRSDRTGADTPPRVTAAAAAMSGAQGQDASSGAYGQQADAYASSRQMGVPAAAHSAYAPANAYGAQASYRPQEQSWQQPGASAPYQAQGGAGYPAGYASGRNGNRSSEPAGGYSAWNGGQGAASGGYAGQQGAPAGQSAWQGAAGQDWQRNQGQGQRQGTWQEPAAPPAWQQGGSGTDQGGKPPRPPKKRHAFVTVLLALALVAGLAVGGTYGLRYYQAKHYVEPYDSVFCQGVYVDGISLGGMTPDEGVAAVTSQAQQRNDAWSVKLTYQGQLVTEITASQLGMTVDVIDVMRVAWEKGHTGDLYTRKAAMESLLATPFQAYTAAPSGDTSVIDGILQDIKNQVYRAPQDAALTEFNPENTYPFTFTDEVQGRMLNTEPIKERLYQMVSTMESGEVEIVPDVIEPSVTIAQLKEKLVQRASVYTPIDKNSTEGRTNNIRRCFQAVSGYILQPGKKFSFNGVVGERTQENGFYEAVEYAYGDLVMGWGGGACQASTTLYQAAVVGGLEILDRTPHSDSVSYAAYGEDATVYWNGKRQIDLVFRNDTDSPIYMVASVQSDPSNRKRLIAKVTMYGESLGDNVRYEMQSQTVKTLTAPTEPEYVKDKKATYVTYTDEEYQARKAKDGYVVESYRVKYVGDQVTERTLLFTDTYEAKAARIYVGVTKREEN